MVSGLRATERERCPHCQGSGKRSSVFGDQVECGLCEGVGYLKVPTEKSVVDFGFWADQKYMFARPDKKGWRKQKW